MVATLAVVFAPGLVSDQRAEHSASAMTAAVLAPTTDDGATVVIARDREATGFELVVIAFAVLALVRGPTWSRLVREHRRRPVLASFISPLSRRGPPAFVA